jgi:aromatic-amino-acid transaminase
MTAGGTSSAPAGAGASSALLAPLTSEAPDPLLTLLDLFKADPRPDKLDLGVGVYRDAAGQTPIMRAVRQAESHLWLTQPTKAYLAAEGDAAFVERLAPIVFGEAMGRDPRLAGVQTVGGTGALRMAADLIARARPTATVWVADPTWPNHAPILTAAGLRIARHPFFDPATQAVLFDEMLEALAAAAHGDILLVQGCCHNPTGAELTAAQWAALTERLVERRVVPFVDLAYQGLGAGLDADAAGLRACLAKVGEALIAYSCDKNFGLYRERTGALWMLGETPAAAAVARSHMLAIARANWSMPPDHGAAVVRTILESERLRTSWQAELAEIRERLQVLRRCVAALHPRLEPLTQQTGMFSLLPLGLEAVGRLRQTHGVYIAGSGRINIAGLQPDRLEAFIEAVRPYLAR